MRSSDRASNLCILACARSYIPSPAVTFSLLMTNVSSSAFSERHASLAELGVDILALTLGRGVGRGIWGGCMV